MFSLKNIFVVVLVDEINTVLHVYAFIYLVSSYTVYGICTIIWSLINPDRAVKTKMVEKLNLEQVIIIISVTLSRAAGFGGLSTFLFFSRASQEHLAFLSWPLVEIRRQKQTQNKFTYWTFSQACSTFFYYISTADFKLNSSQEA